MKQRVSSLDVKVLAAELGRTLPTLYLQNIYDLSSRIFLFKFAKPGQRHQLLVDVGFRCHLTSFARTTAAEPSAFVARLRKLLRSRRVSAVHQVGADRVIEVCFGEDARYRLFLEFFAEGNVVVTDAEYHVLALHRRVQASERQEELRVGATYQVSNRHGVGGGLEITRERVRGSVERALERRAAEPRKGKQKRKGDNALVKALSSGFMEFPTVLLEHAARIKGYDLSPSLERFMEDESLLDKLLDVLREAKSIFDNLAETENAKGYIVAKPSKQPLPEPSERAKQDGTDKENDSMMYEEFHPFRPCQFEGRPGHHILEFEGFNYTVDKFYSSIESQTLTSRLNDREAAAKRKLETAKADHQNRIGGLQQVQELNVRKAQAIEGNLHRVQEAVRAVNGLIAQGMDWVELAQLIEMEQARINPVAQTVKLPLKLYENTVTLLLAEEGDEDDDDFEGRDSESESSESDEDGGKNVKANEAKDKLLSVDIDLGLTPWANAGEYYDHRKSAAVKQEKTEQSSTKALKNTEKKITADLKKGLQQEKQVLRPVRKQLWFEKFYYFISSEGYLVVGGRDAQQNEILYQKYLSHGDAFVHANIKDATSFIVKNKPSLKDSEIPPSTLSQAGTLCVASSVAWESKAVMAAWWVKADQVTKTTSTGYILPPGSFETIGEKNYLPPAQLLLGFGVMFRVSKESKKRHTKHRVPLDGTEIEAPAEDLEAKPGASQDIPNDLQDNETARSGEPEGQQVGDEQEFDVHEDDDAFSIKSDHSKEEPDKLRHHPLAEPDKLRNQPLAEPDELQDGPPENPEDLEESHADGNMDEGYANPLLARRDHPGIPSSESRPPQDQGQDDESVDEDGAIWEAEIAGTHPASQTKDVAMPKQPDDDSASVATSTTRPQAGAQVRGKRGQRAKQKKKYAHQDEEDRALALRLLGARTQPAEAEAEATQAEAREAKQQAQRERAQERAAKAERSAKEAESARQERMQRRDDGLDPDEQAELALVEDFVGAPRPGDEILDCVVVCGPWASLGARLRWRVKVQPGTQKRGKALKEILGGWAREIVAREKKRMPGREDEGYEEERVLRREGEMIKGIRDVEVVGTIPVKAVRIVAGGGEAAGAGKGKGAKGGGGKGGGKGQRGGRGSKKK